MSNALLVGAKRSATGKPLFVAGPQVGHFYPGILLELDLEGGGFKARGAAFPGISFAVLLGRGIDYAWSATSAGADLVDQYVETLCDGRHVVSLSRRVPPMSMFDAGTIVGRPGEPDRPLVPRDGARPRTGYATVEGKRVAISTKRSTRGRELRSLGFFLDMSMNRVRSAQDFLRSAAGMELTFNWLYADSRDIAQFTSGRLPVRPSTVDPGLPTKGTGEHEWAGLRARLRARAGRQPAERRDPQLEQQAGAWLRSRRQRVDVGAVQRVDLLWAGIERRRKHTLGSRRRRDERRRDPGPARDARLAGGAGRPRARDRDRTRAVAAAQAVDAWYAAGGSRLDADLDGKVDSAGAASLDEALAEARDAVLAPVLDAELRAGLAQHRAERPAARHDGSSAYSGWWSYVHKDLRSLLGRPVPGAYRTRFCGGGDVARVRRLALGRARRGGRRARGGPGAGPSDVAPGRDEGADQLRAGILTRTMRGSNKPTFQQAITFATHR